jgi:hypothetical protein
MAQAGEDVAIDLREIESTQERGALVGTHPRILLT